MIIATLFAVLIVIAWSYLGLWLLVRAIDRMRYSDALFIAWIVVTLIIQWIISHV
jgi:hypothetical protein